MKILSLPTCFSYWLTCISGRFGWCFQGMPAGLLGWDKVGWMVGGENDGGDEGTDNSTWSTMELGVWQGIRLRRIGARGLLSEVSLPFCEGPFKWVYMIRSHFVKTIFFYSWECHAHIQWTIISISFHPPSLPFSSNNQSFSQLHLVFWNFWNSGKSNYDCPSVHICEALCWNMRNLLSRSPYKKKKTNFHLGMSSWKMESVCKNAHNASIKLSCLFYSSFENFRIAGTR